MDITPDGSSQIRRYSSLEGRLDYAFLAQKLKGAKSYKRIAGYFRSSIFELVGEEIGEIPEVRIVCNSELDAYDIAISKSARETALKGVWNQVPIETEGLLHRERYRRLYELLKSGRVKIKVVPRDTVFLHGKAGVIEQNDGSKTAFLGSVNETRAAFVHNYEILWEDSSSDACTWVEREFDLLWEQGYDLPDAIINEIGRVSERVEVSFPELQVSEVPAAVMVESPIYRGGEGLQPWQRSFVAAFLEHREIFGKARLLLADEVGLGKTLSMATAALVASLLGDGPTLILCPATLTLQWQTELKDNLGIPSAVWLSNKKQWINPNGQVVRGDRAEVVASCPFQVGIVSTGLITHNSTESKILRKIKFGTLILDEAHKASVKSLFNKKVGESNLRKFMVDVAPNIKHILLGTATPIQTEPEELWNLLGILGTGADFVMGRGCVAEWKNFEKTHPIITGERPVSTELEAWALIRSPLPPEALGDQEGRSLVQSIRSDLDILDKEFFTDKSPADLHRFTRSRLEETLGTNFFRRNNPFVRHVMLRRRDTLEELQLLKKVDVNIHPNSNATRGTYGSSFEELGLVTNYPFQRAYESAEDLGEELKKREKGASLFLAIFLQRICSSFASGLSTTKRILDKQIGDSEEDSDLTEQQGLLSTLTKSEIGYMEAIQAELSRTEAVDPKLAAVKQFLESQVSEDKTWAEWGSVIFSQYFDTVSWVAEELAKSYPEKTIAVYAGAAKSGLYREGQFVRVSREAIKDLVKSREVTLVVATDAACEGLNLQTLGTLINIDLPWNPARLEQRLGRIKRFGQARSNIDMLNLVYQGTRDEKVYKKLSERMKGRYGIFGSIPDCIDAEWIDEAEGFEEKAKTHLYLRGVVENIFEEKSKETLGENEDSWERCTKVLSRRDIYLEMSRGWKE